jgi:nucleotide-binding universal stress UspA family protein
MFKNILIPTDGSSLSQRTAMRGVELAKAIGAKVTAFYAAPAATPVLFRKGMPAGLSQPADNAARIEREANRHLGAIEAAAKKARVRFEGLHATDDYPADAILKVAKKKKCDVIVMATHGERGLFTSSVTQKVLDDSKLPVLVFR